MMLSSFVAVVVLVMMEVAIVLVVDEVEVVNDDDATFLFGFVAFGSVDALPLPPQFGWSLFLGILPGSLLLAWVRMVAAKPV